MQSDPSPTQADTEGDSHPTQLAALRAIDAADPFRWLAAGWRDFLAAPGIGVFYGACFAVMGALMLWMFARSPPYVLALAGAFLLIGPFLCLGLYRVSRDREHAVAPSLVDSLTAWRANPGALAIYCGVLLVLELLWSRSALVVFAVAFEPVPEAGSTLAALLHRSNLGFVVVYTLVGAVFASLIYATTVVSMPMLIDQRTDAITAAITSFRVCLTYPRVMSLWAIVIVAVIGLGMALGLIGLLVAAPVIGHASWHAYRGCVSR